MQKEKTKEEKKQILDEKIMPLMINIMTICQKERIPMAATFAICSEEEPVTEYQNEIISPFSVNENPTPDKVAEFIKILNGFHAVPERPDVINMEELEDGMEFAEE